MHRVFGISYLGASPPSAPIAWPLRLLNILWNVAVLCFSYYTFHISTAETIETFGNDQRVLNGTTVVMTPSSQPLILSTTPAPTTSTIDGGGGGAFLQKSLTPLVNYIRFASLMVYFLFSYLLNIYLGFMSRPLIALVAQTIQPALNAEAEHRIGARIALVQLIAVLILSAIFQGLLYSNFGQIQWIRLLENLLNLYSLSSTVTLIAYVNFCCGCLLHSTSLARSSSKVGHENVSDLSFGQYIECLQHVSQVIREATKLLAPAILVVIFNAAIVNISSLTLLVADFQTSYFISIIGIIDYNTLLISLCLVSSHAFEKASDICEAYKEDIYRDENRAGLVPGDRGNGARLVMLNTLPTRCGMSPYGLFCVSKPFMVSFFAFILSYSVILIQTSESAPPTCPRP